MLRNRVQNGPAVPAGEAAASPGRPASASRITETMVAEARRLYEESELSQVEIARRVGLSRSSLGRLAARESWRRRSVERARAVSRIRCEVDRQISAVEAVFAGQDGLAAGEAAVHARTLASLVRSLRELQKYEAGQAIGAAEDDDADGAPADIDALRDALADRIARLRGEDA